MQLRLKKWSDLNVGKVADASVVDVKHSATSTLLGGDYSGIKFQILADEGTQVSAGQAVMCDRRHPQIVFTSPVSGVVSTIQRGKRRSLISMRISLEGGQNPVSFEQNGMAPLYAQVLDLLEKQNTTRKVSYRCGGRCKRELYYDDQFEQLDAKYDNFSTG